MSQSIPTGYTPGQAAPGQKMMVEFSGVGQKFPKLEQKLLLKLAKNP